MAAFAVNRTIVAAWVVFWGVMMVCQVGAAERLLRGVDQQVLVEKEIREDGYMVRLINLLRQNENSTYHHVWPEMKLEWRLVLGSIIGFFGAALGSVGGVGGGGIFVPMLTLIIGFDAKSSTAISKCMIMGAAGSAVYYNLRIRHPTLDLPVIDFDLALLFQPMLMLGISIGVAFNVIFAEWMVTLLLIILFLGTSTKALFKGIETWKKETIMKKEAARLLEPETKPTDGPGLDYKPLPGGPSSALDDQVPVMDNIYWKELTLLVSVWVAILAVQIVKTYAKTCSFEYWLLNLLQVPIAVSVSLYEAVCLYKGKRVIASKGKEVTNLKVHLLFFYCLCGIVAGVVGGLLGLGGGFILGPLFLELGIPPQVCPYTNYC
uniref:Sulfite exporter TauE/SafE family protein 3-like n=1 Tax=Nelumbo nucifera TaxID=4432 RepID=A0A822Z762_NELNU|nr:TPA_asm: hypothetical protein HUJ06_015020 [Nelumbo nucifera]